MFHVTEAYLEGTYDSRCAISVGANRVRLLPATAIMPTSKVRVR